MPQQDNENEILESEPDIPDDLDEEVGGQDAPEDEPEPRDDDQYAEDSDAEDTEFEETEDSADETVGEPIKPAPKPDARYEKMQAHMEQLNGLVMTLAQTVQNQQPAYQQPAPSRTPPPQIEVPLDVDDLSQREAIRYALQQSQDNNLSTVTTLARNLEKRLSIYDHLLDRALQNHPQRAVIGDALQIMQRNPAMTFQTALETAEGVVAKKRVADLEKQNHQSRKAQHKRRDKARHGSTRPTQLPKPKTTRPLSIREAIEQADAEFGRT